MPDPAAAVDRRRAGVVRWSRARRTAIVVVDAALAVGAGALAAPAGASAARGPGPAPAAGWTTGRAPLPRGPDAPAPDPTVQLSDESCSSALACVAVGTYMDVVGQDRGLLETRSGGSWSATEPPLPLDAGQDSPSYLDSVSCPVDGWCQAVGVYVDVSRGTDVVIDSLTGGRWSAIQAPLPADAAKGSEADSFLKSIDCNAVGSCTAVGSYKQSTGGTAGFVDTLASGHWFSETTPQPPGAAAKEDVHLMQVSCPSVGPCAASGFYTNGDGEDQALLLDQTAGGWTAQDAPLPAGAASGTGETSESFGVSCSGGLCEAVGSYADGAGAQRGLLEHWDGATWSASDAPVPNDAGSAAGDSASLSAVSCTFDGCVGVGDYEDASAGLRPLIDTVLTSGAAVATEGPQPANRAASSDASLVAVSCASLSTCTAVGSYRTGSGPGGPVALTDMLSGTAWNAVDAPVPSSAASGAAARSTLAAVSCATRGACGAAGDYAGRHAQWGLLQRYTPAEGYWTNAIDGGVFAFGRARFHGSSGDAALNQDVVGMAPTPGGSGYWEVAKDGGVFAFGDARFYGSANSAHPAAPMVGIVATPSGNGYWLVAADGGVFAYGDALDFGSPNGFLAHPITGMAASPDGRGYWLVASDGGVYAYGDAVFYGSPGGAHVNAPVLGIAASPTGKGYWLVAADGGVFAYGDARYHGEANGLTMNKPVVGLMPSLDGGGYWVISSAGGIFAFGDAAYLGSSSGGTSNAPTVGGAPA